MSIKTCKQHAKEPVFIYAACAGCEIQRYREQEKVLKAENESLRADAERYRWIKKESNLSDYEDCYSLPMVHAWDYKPGPELNEQFESLDAAIEAAMSKGERP